MIARETAVGDAELREGLKRALATTGNPPPLEVRRHPSDYRSSFPLEELDLRMEDGSELRLAFKQLGWSTLNESARLAKPRFLHDPRRESAVYASLLAPLALGPPRYYGATVQPQADRYWLFVEWVDGRELYQVGDRGVWEAAARWLGEMHLQLAKDLDRHSERGRLLAYDATHYRRWINRAREFSRAPGQPASRSRSLDWLGERYEAVVDGILALPKTVIHGDFYASNVLVVGAAPTRVSPVDWELAATAPGLVDLAALISGGWGAEDREEIVGAYRSAVGPEAFSTYQLDLVRLQLAVQWLGWAPPDWIAPQGQRHDWLGEALALAEGLGL